MNKTQSMRRGVVLFFLVLFILLTASLAMAQESISLHSNQSSSLTVDGVITRIAVANPDIADVMVISRDEILTVAKKPGTTTLYIWFDDGMRREYAVNVSNRDVETAQAIQKLLGYSGLTVEKAGEKILLEGKVENQLQKNRAQKVAEMYSDKVVNLLEMTHPAQIRIEAKILEISTDKVKKLGIQLANASDIDKDTGIITIGTTGVFGFGQSFSNSRDSSKSKAGSYADINGTLQALVTNGDAKVLSQPSIVTLSGEKANILVGGEIPIPISNTSGQITVEWREYGIKLLIEPQIGTGNLITSKVNAEVSILDSTSAAAINLSSGLSIPALRSRKAETVLQLPSGSTMAIGGLLTSDDSKQVIKVPFLGDLPVIGQFFRSTNSTREKREIIILVKPTLVDETAPVDMSPEMQKWSKDTPEKSGDVKADTTKK